MGGERDADVVGFRDDFIGEGEAEAESWLLKSLLRRRIADASEKARRVKAMTKREAQAARTG